MRSNYRETKNDLVHCPFNPAHKVKKCRLITHKKICPDKDSKGFVQCPYNPSHNVTIENLEKHKAKCPNRVIINPDLEKEMEDFIKNKNNGNIGNSTINTVNKEYKEDKENNQNNCNEIEELSEKKMKKKNINKKKNGKAKKEKEKEKAVDLENMTNKELFNFIFNDNMVIEYHSDSSENNEDEINNCRNEDLKDDDNSDY